MIEINYEYDKVNKDLVDENWTYNISQIILEENGHNEAQITIIFSNDLKLHKFRKGQPDDYISLSTKSNYIWRTLRPSNTYSSTIPCIIIR